MKLVIEGRPVTKKNSGQLVRVRGRMLPIPSKAYRRWERAALPQLRAQWSALGFTGRAVRKPCNVRALFFRPFDGPGDPVNYYQAIGDALQAAGVVLDDRLIASWDGSRLRVDRRRPRVELDITTVVD